MEKKSVFKLAGVLGAAALTLSLAACSGGQSVAEACQVANSTVNDATGDLQSIMSDVTSGGDLSTAFEPISAALDEAKSKVTNEEVSTALADVTAQFNAMSDTLSGFEIPDTSNIDPTDPEQMAELEKFQEESAEISTKLQEQSTALTESGKKLQEVCSAG
ncbi:MULTISPECIES: hypothetical protein [Leucobacter]|uniref:hypothetical protein n=1 Tax=Leucobacter TaxID=55968 RepID=UPI0006A7C991|nr:MULTISPECIES: hypothetical protein [Leucobacter]